MLNKLCIVLLVLCIGILSVKIHKNNKEQFACGYTPELNQGETACLTDCINTYNSNKGNSNYSDCTDPDDAEGCVKKCRNASLVRNTDAQGNTLCEIGAQIDPISDIHGTSVEKCVKNCSDNTPETCRNFSLKMQDGRIQRGTFSNNVNNFQSKCTSSNYKDCSPCVEACLACDDPTRCKWIETPEEQDTRQLFRRQKFVIQLIPGNNRVTLVWNEVSENVKEYVILLYKKQQPDMVLTEVKPFTNTGENTHVITGLSNDMVYTVTINKVSDHQQSVVVASNTMDFVPSVVDITNFSRINRDNSLKQRDLMSVGFMKSLKGKTLDISL